VLYQLFAPFGAVLKVTPEDVWKDVMDVATVWMASAAEAARAASIDGSQIGDSIIRVQMMPLSERPSGGESSQLDSGGSSSLVTNLVPPVMALPLRDGHGSAASRLEEAPGSQPRLTMDPLAMDWLPPDARGMGGAWPGMGQIGLQPPVRGNLEGQSSAPPPEPSGGQAHRDSGKESGDFSLAISYLRASQAQGSQVPGVPQQMQLPQQSAPPGPNMQGSYRDIMSTFNGLGSYFARAGHKVDDEFAGRTGNGNTGAFPGIPASGGFSTFDHE